MSAAEKLTQSESREQLWQMGVVAPWYLKKYQLDGYQLLLNQRFPFFEWSRRIGKTTTVLVHKAEKALRIEGYVCRWCEPWKGQARQIVMPEIDKLNLFAPNPKFKFKYYNTDSFYEVPATGGRIYLLGVNEDRGESARGPYAHDVVADEFGSWKEPRYIINEVFMPQVLSTNGAIAEVSTPPRDLGHAYYEEKDRAAREGRLSRKTIWAAEGQLYSRGQIEEICAAVGGVNSPAWQREFLCEPVSDPDLLIVPEWSVDNIVANDYPRPEFYTPYVGGDSGADDNTAVLFGYYDFTTDTVIVEQEYVTNGKTTSEIVGHCKLIEKELWGTVPVERRVYDAAKQLIFDIYTDLKWPVQMPEKDGKLAAIHDLRVEVGARRFKIKEHCKHTIRQLKVGMWKDERHSDFERTEGLGHLDAVAAAIYLNRTIKRKLNPNPLHHGKSRFTHYIPNHSGANEDDALRRAFKPRRL